MRPGREEAQKQAFIRPVTTMGKWSVTSLGTLGFSYPTHSGRTWALTHQLPSTTREGPSLLQHFLPGGRGSRRQPQGRAWGFGSRTGMHPVGRPMGIGQHTHSGDTRWPSQGGQDPEVGRGKSGWQRRESQEVFRKQDGQSLGTRDWGVGGSAGWGLLAGGQDG